MPEYDATTAMRSRWRNPVFLAVFVPPALAWLSVILWLTWLYFNPVMGWVGRQNGFLQEILTTLIWGGCLLVSVIGLGACCVLAERIAGLPPAGANASGQTTGKHAGWTPPKRS